MTFLDVFSLFVLVVIIGLLVYLILLLAWFPGHVARQRHSPWAEAINVAGWIGILLFPIWMLALIAAFIRPRTGQGAAIAISQDEAKQLEVGLKAISTRIGNLEADLRNIALHEPHNGAGGQ